MGISDRGMKAKNHHALCKILRDQHCAVTVASLHYAFALKTSVGPKSWSVVDVFSAKAKRQQHGFVCAKAKRQQHGFVCAKAKRQQQHLERLSGSHQESAQP
ncbi:hypothetical protein LAV73_01710 [Lysinibacillus xylanilyticus]|uniref:hypothetical protein n=1 Tax=Lysinibacillus xylanilyticus TaxID=582475 RepID=UPI002B245719|nr:hypothetical protein [Lysinibacillus xylanilyticus]MEB2278724.1 hypothetical protein [Lysinibacillus xylanilyticus]